MGPCLGSTMGEVRNTRRGWAEVDHTASALRTRHRSFFMLWDKFHLLQIGVWTCKAATLAKLKGTGQGRKRLERLQVYAHFSDQKRSTTSQAGHAQTRSAARQLPARVSEKSPVVGSNFFFSLSPSPDVSWHHGLASTLRNAASLGMPSMERGR